MIQQKLSLFQCLTSVPSKAVGLEEVVRLIRSRLRRPSAGEKVTLMNSGMICRSDNGAAGR